MKARKKPRGTKARVQAFKKRLAYVSTAITIAILVATVAFSSFLIYYYLDPSPNHAINLDQTNNQPSQPTAAIVDHLSLTWPNQTFTQTATNTMKEAGYTVDYYPGEEVNVELYRNLPTHGYGLIILRVHSTATEIEGPQLVRGPVTLFTSEPYSKTKYVPEQLTNQLQMAVYSREDLERGITYFCIRPPFVTNSMIGRFQNTIIIMMGCEGLDNTLMAKAFVEKGAKVYISWNHKVSASHTDLATTHLLQHFLVEELTLKEAVRETFKEVGFDPTFKSRLIYYPSEVGSQTIEDIAGDRRTNMQSQQEHNKGIICLNFRRPLLIRHMT